LRNAIISGLEPFHGAIGSFVIRFLKKQYPQVIFSIDTKDDAVFLTIDDSPSPHTGVILDILKENNVTATFFVIGSYVNKYDPDGIILKRMISEGHEIGNHMMYNHMGAKLAPEQLSAEIMECENIIKSKLGSMTHYFRPGSGLFTANMIDIAKKHGYTIVIGSVYPHDPHIRSVSHIVWSVMRKVDKGSIIILHDNYEYNIGAFSKLMPLLKSRGFSINRLSDGSVKDK